MTGTQSPGETEVGLDRLREKPEMLVSGWHVDSTQEPDALVAHVRICAGGLIQAR